MVRDSRPSSVNSLVMSQCNRIGIVGGYDSTRRILVAKLWKSCTHEIRIGGRDLAKGPALAASFDGRVSKRESNHNPAARCLIVGCKKGRVLASASVADQTQHAGGEE